jgi:hypothetical protein
MYIVRGLKYAQAKNDVFGRISITAVGLTFDTYFAFHVMGRRASNRNNQF